MRVLAVGKELLLHLLIHQLLQSLHLFLVNQKMNHHLHHQQM
jgi:hypothetical protein